MIRTLTPAIALVIGLGVPTALADDRPLTDQERTQLAAAMKAIGCSGGKAEVDDDEIEVDDARCDDGKTYDLEFDKSFKLIEKDSDD